MMRVVFRRLHLVLGVGIVATVAALAPLAAQQRPAPLVLSQLTWFDRTGKMLGRLGPLADHGNLEISPDGARVAVAVADRALRTRNIWMYQTGSGTREQFTTDAADENWLIFSPDGGRVVLSPASSPPRPPRPRHASCCWMHPWARGP
jgi:hypothetical protein